MTRNLKIIEAWTADFSPPNKVSVPETKSHADLPEYLARHHVEVVASLPCYPRENVDGQRGGDLFEKSIRALKKLNTVGNGKPLYPWDVTPASMVGGSLLGICFWGRPLKQPLGWAGGRGKGG